MARSTGNDDLYKLIHSLSPEEKGYFKKFSLRHSSEQNTYFKIFDDIAKQQKFDEKTLKAKYKNYATQKVHLFESIMDSLFIYQREGDGKYNPHYNAIYFYILYRKNLLRRAEVYIGKTIEMVAKEEWLPVHIEFLEHKLNLEKRKWDTTVWQEKCGEIFEQINYLRKQELNRDKHSQIFHQLYYILMCKEQQLAEVPDPDKSVDIAFLKNRKNALSILTQRVRLFSLSNYYKIKNDPAGDCKACKELYDFEADCLSRRSLLTNVRFLSSALRGLLHALIEINDTAKAGKIFEKDWVLNSGNRENEFYNTIRGHTFNTYENYLYYCQFYSLLCWHNKSYKKGLELLIKEENKIANNPLNERFMAQLHDIYKCKILFTYINGNMQKAMLGINELEALGIKKNYTKMFKDCQWVKVLVQLKLNNFDIAQNMIGNMIRSSYKAQFSTNELDCLVALKKNPMQQPGVMAGQVKIFGLMDLNEGLQLARK